MVFSRLHSSALFRKLLLSGFVLGVFIMSWYSSPLLDKYSALASGIMHVQVGDTVELGSPDVGNYQYSWVLKKGDQVVPQVVTGEEKQTQSASSQPKFRHTFREAGTYDIELLRTNAQTGEVQNTSVTVLVSLDAPSFAEKKAVLKTLPPAQEDGVVLLPAKGGEVVFFAADSGSDVEEFQIDSDIGEDSNGDGVTDNDVDNENHPSFYTGQGWSMVYSPVKSSYLAQLTVKYTTGEIKKSTVEIRLSDDDLLLRQGKSLKAVLETVPPADSDGVIYLSGTQGKVTFYAGHSEGQIVEYRMDKNIQFDTNGDGTPDNDIDNRDTASFEDGGPWETNFDKSWGDIVVQLLVVSPDRKGSKIQRKVVFDDVKAAAMRGQGETTTAAGQSIKLITSQTEINAGEHVTFTLFGAPDGTEFAWDFDGDTIIDYQGIRTSNTYQYGTPGEFPVVVTATRNGVELAKLGVTVMVKGGQPGEILTNAPLADFTFFAQDNTFSFQNTSSADERLLNRELVASWDFGDTATSDESNPVHTYGQVGAYTVVLTITDAVGRSSTTAQNIEVKTVPTTDTVEPNPEDNTQQPEENTQNPETGSDSPAANTESTSGWVWILLSIFLVPILLIGGYLIVRKIQFPDLSFEEIIAEDLEKLKHWRTPVAPKAAAPKPEVATSPVEAIEVADAEVVTAAPSTAQEQPAEMATPPTTSQEPPAWLKQNSEQTAQVPTPAPESSVSENVPDWLKTDSSSTPSVADNQSENVEGQDTTVSSDNAVSEAETSTPTAEPADTPDWLKADADTVDSNAQNEAAPEAAEETPDWLKTDVAAPTSNEPSDSADMPDWLKGNDESAPSTAGSNEEDNQEAPDNTTEASSEDTPDWLKTDIPEETNTSPQDNTDAMPDWLKGDDTNS